MALLASVSVYECDSCKTVAVCQDKESWRRYETDWHETVLHQFCPNCRNLPAIAKTIVKDRQKLITLIAGERNREDANSYVN